MNAIILGPYQVHSSDDGGKTPLENPDRHSVVGLTPARSRRIQSVAGSHSHFRPLFKFAGKHFGKPIIARSIWYIHGGFLFWIIPSTW